MFCIIISSCKSHFHCNWLIPHVPNMNYFSLFFKIVRRRDDFHVIKSVLLLLEDIWMIVTEKYIEKFLRTNGIQDEYHVIHFCRELKINHYFKLLIFGMLTCCCDLRILIQSQFSITNFDTIFVWIVGRGI